MRHTLHLFIGNGLTAISEAVVHHLQKQLKFGALDYTHVASAELSDGQTTLRMILPHKDKVSFCNAEDTRNWLDNLHSQTITLQHPGESTCLYVFLYVQLYDEEGVALCKNIIDVFETCTKSYALDIVALGNELSDVIRLPDALQENERLYKEKETTKKTLRQLVEYKSGWQRVNRINFLQNTNVRGIGLNLDRDTFVYILGEYVAQTSSNFTILYPPSAIPSKEVHSFGLSELRFGKQFFSEYLRDHALIYLLEREGIGVKGSRNPIELLSQATDMIDNAKQKLTGLEEKTFTDESIAILAYQKDVKSIEDNGFNHIIDNQNLGLTEKRALLAILTGDDDPVLDDDVLLKELPTVDDCMDSAISLYVNGVNRLGKKISGPQNDEGQLYNPIGELKTKLRKIRESQSFIRKSDERLKQIEDGLQWIEESKKFLTDQGFTYEGTTYQLQHNVIEHPLEKTWQAKDVSTKSVDLRKFFSPIRDQKNLGACAPFSLSAIFESILNKVGVVKDTKFSPRFLYYNVSKKNTDETPLDEGSSFYDCIQSLGANGICKEELCPYDGGFANKPDDNSYLDGKDHLVSEAMNVNIAHKDITSALAEGYPIAISLKIFDSFGKNKAHKGFIFRPTEAELASTDFGYHAMVICGYSEEDKVYIVRNSWSTHFGDQGYCYIPFSYLEDPGLCRQACIITGVNCVDMKTDLPETVVDFDLSNKDIEYAVVRIKRDEEKLHLENLKEQYDTLYREYMLLLSDLSKATIQNDIVDQIVAHIPPHEKITLPPTSGPEEQKSATPLIVFLISLVALVLSLLLLKDDTRNVACLITACVVGFSVCKLLNSKSKEKSAQGKIILPVIVHPDESLSLKLKYLLAGEIINQTKDEKQKLSHDRRLLISYIRNLQQWRKEALGRVEKGENTLRHPVISIFSEKEAKAFFDTKSEAFTVDVSLSKIFGDFDGNEDTTNDIQKKILKKVTEGIDQVLNSFSMCNYLCHTQNYDFLPAISDDKLAEWLVSIQLDSIPFLQIYGAMVPVQTSVIFIHSNDSIQQQNWQNTLNSTLSSIPSISNLDSQVKLISFQVVEANTDELQIYH